MNKYETIMIVKPTLSEEQWHNEVDKIKELINKNGKVTSTEFWGMRKLAYPVKKYNEGYYADIYFSSDFEFVDELLRVYNESENIIKHIIVKKD